MAFDGVVLNAIKSELSELLKGARVDKIYQPESDEIVMLVRSNNTNYKLFISADANYPRIHITGNNFKNPDTPPLFCMLLRKHLISSKLIDFYQMESDRILKMDFEAYNELGDLCIKSIIVEIMGRFSNIIFVNEKGIIVDAVKRIDLTVSSKRQVLPGLFYETAPAQEKMNFLDFENEELEKYVFQNKEVAADKFAMETFLGISPLVSREIAYRIFKENNKMIQKDDILSKQQLFEGVISFFDDVKRINFTPSMVLVDRVPKFFSCIELTQYSNLYDMNFCSSISKIVEDFYLKLHFARKMSVRTHNIIKKLNILIEKTQKKITIHKDILLNVKEKEKYKLYGELLTANLYKLKGGEKSINVLNYYTNEEIIIPLNEHTTPSKNLQKYFNEFKKSKTAEDYSKKLLKKLEDELYYLESELEFLKKSKDQDEIDAICEELISEGYLVGKKDKKNIKKKINTKFNEFVSSDGFNIVVGKNNKQNDEITFKLSKPNDIWLHVKNYPGSHTLIKSNGEEIPDKTLYEGACLAAFYSKAVSGGKVTVDYTNIKFVKKQPGAKPGMVTYTNFKSVVAEVDEEVINRLKNSPDN